MKKGKKYLAGLALAAGLMAFSIPAFSADYTKMSLEEMAQLRTQMRTASQEERAEFQKAWREKMQNASPEERQLYSKGRMGQAQAGTPKGTCDGTGPKGHAYKKGAKSMGAGAGGGFHHGGGHGRGHK